MSIGHRRSYGHGAHRNPPSQGESIYPSPSADPIGRRLGLTPFRKCVQCGARNDTRRRSWSNRGEGLGTPDSEGSRDVVSGCFFCGSKKWLHDRPNKKWPSANKIPAQIYRRRHY